MDNLEYEKYEKDFNEYKKEVVLLNNKKIKYNQMQKDLRKYYNQKFIKKMKLKSSLKYLNKKNLQSLTEMQREINEDIEMIEIVLDDILEKENKLDNKIDKINNEIDKLYFKYYEQNLDKLKYDKSYGGKIYDNFNNNYQNKFKEYYKNINSILKAKTELKEKINKLKRNLQTDKQRDELDDLYLQFAHQHDLDKMINNNLYIYLSNFVKVDQLLKDINMKIYNENNPKSETNLESEEPEKEKKDFITELISNELITFDIFILFIGLIEQNSDTKSILEHIFLIDNMGISHGCMICNRYITKDNKIRSFYKSNNLKYGLCLRDALIRKVFNYGRFDSGCFHSYDCSCKKCRYIY